MHPLLSFYITLNQPDLDQYIFRKMEDLNNQILELKKDLVILQAENKNLRERNSILEKELEAKKEACVNLTLRVEEEVKKRHNNRTSRYYN